MKKVYHTKSFSLNTLLTFNTDGYSPFKDDYELVAVVNCEEVGQVFDLTNTYDYDEDENLLVWWEKDGVCFVKDADGQRSTSVGDLVEDEKGQLHLCCSMGWRDVEWNEGLKSEDMWWKHMYEKYNDLNAQV